MRWAEQSQRELTAHSEGQVQTPRHLERPLACRHASAPLRRAPGAGHDGGVSRCLNNKLSVTVTVTRHWHILDWTGPDHSAPIALRACIMMRRSRRRWRRPASGPTSGQLAAAAVGLSQFGCHKFLRREAAWSHSGRTRSCRRQVSLRNRSFILTNMTLRCAETPCLGHGVPPSPTNCTSEYYRALLSCFLFPSFARRLAFSSSQGFRIIFASCTNRTTRNLRKK